MTGKLILKNITLFLIILLSINDVAAKKFKYGYINNISNSSNGDISECLQRGEDECRKIYPGATIYVGDKLTLKTDDIIVEYCNIIAECKQATDITVFPPISNEESSAIKKSATKIDDVLSWFGLNIWETTQYYAVQAVSRGDSNISKKPPNILLANMNKVPQYIFANKRALVFQWKNGAAPFNIKIMQQKKLVFNAQTREQRIQTNQINWASGEYQISIEDKYGRAKSVHFYVVNRPEFAKQLHSYFSGESNKSIHQYARIGTMAMVDGGRYALEAYQQLLPISTQSAALTSLQKAVEAGEIFPEIKNEEVMQRLLN
ncbi:MAG: hypothetical protein methR_P2591 [Methyloprofundus sp.]|nr:MAG: hypothetical protein methR_P2591 [Methyloprofundus sp.]